MKKYLILLSAICLAFSSCKKDRNNDNTPINTPDPNAMQYTINGLTDITLKANHDSMVLLAITHASGKQEKINMVLTDLPANVTASLETPSGVPTFASKLFYSAKTATPGTYSIKLKATSASDSVKLLNINLVITAPPASDSGCANKVLGTFNNTYTGSVSGSTTTKIEWSGDNSKVKITGLPGYPGEATAIMICNEKKINLFTQSSGGKTITAGSSGTFTDSKITFSYGVSDGGPIILGYECVLTK